MKALRFRNALICEYVARGNGNRHTLVNVFSGNIVLPNMPSGLSIGLYAEYVPDPGAPREVMIDVELRRKNVARLQVVIPHVAIVLPVTLALAALTFEVTGPGSLSFVASAEGYRRTTVVTKEIVGPADPKSIAEAHGRAG